MRLFERTTKAKPEDIIKVDHPDIHLYIGIDPGVSGAIAAIDQKQNVLLLKDWPGDEIGAADIIRKLVRDYDADIKAALEKAQAVPGQATITKGKFGGGPSPRSQFKFGTNFGIWRGVLAAFQIPFGLPHPKTWQKGVLAKAQDKKPAMAAASRMFPKAEIYGPRGGKKDGRADALLIADWCRRQFI